MRDTIKLVDEVKSELNTGHVEDALYPCPKCGKGGSPAQPLKCEACGHNTVGIDDMQCPKCQHRYARASVPVMVFICQVCQKPGQADHYIDNPNARSHPECVAR